jgi:hypothetical protein
LRQYTSKFYKIAKQLQAVFHLDFALSYCIMSESPAKRARIELTLDDKVKLIKDAQSVPKLTQKEISLKYGLGKSTVSDVLKKKEVYLREFESNANSKKKRFNNACKFDRLNDLVFQWFKQARAKGMPVSCPLIQEKALQFATELSITDFKASTGWLDSWRTRHSIKSAKVGGEAASVDEDVVKDWHERIPDITAGYRPEDVFYCNETGLFFKTMPDKTLAEKSESCKGGKQPKDRLTVLFTCSQTGENLSP